MRRFFLIFKLLKMKNALGFFAAIALGLTITFASCGNAETSNEDVSQASVVGGEAPAKLAKQEEKTPEKEGLQIGETAPDFSLKNIDGNMYSFADIKDANGDDPKGYIVTFTCNTCPFAVGYEDRLVALHSKMSAQGYPVVAIQPNDPEVKPGDSMEEMKKRAEEKGFEFVYLLDEGQKIYPQYGASRTPEIYLLDKDLTLRYTGAIDDSAQDANAVKVNYVESAVEAIEKGEDPDPALTKAIGCTIKAKKT